MSCARVETPRTGSADPFPVFLKCGHATAWAFTNYTVGGPWSGNGCSNGAVTDWGDTSGYAQGMWRVDSTANTADECLLLFPGTIDGIYPVQSLGRVWSHCLTNRWYLAIKFQRLSLQRIMLSKSNGASWPITGCSYGKSSILY